MQHEVGISGFANSAPGFLALFRERFSDFLVHEVALGGEVALLRTLDIPTDLEEGDPSKRAKLTDAPVPTGARPADAAATATGETAGEGGSVEDVRGKRMCVDVSSAAEARGDDALILAGADRNSATTADATTEVVDATTDAAAEEAAASASEAAEVLKLAVRWEACAAGMAAVFGDKSEAARAAVASLRNDPAGTKVLLPSTTDKVVRKAAHDLLHLHLSGLVDADTVDDPDAPPAEVVEVTAANAPPTSVESPMDRFKREQALAALPAAPARAAANPGAEPTAAVPSAPAVQKRSNSAANVPKCIRVWRTTKRKRAGLAGLPWQVKSRQEWPSDRPPYLRFALYKENCDTLFAADKLSQLLGVNRGDLSYAGTKDKRACTTQWLTAWKLPPTRVAKAINNQFHDSGGKWGRNLLVGNFSYVEQPLRLGDLDANRFGITLRRLQALRESGEGRGDSEETLTTAVTAAAEAMAASGFVNFFGLQRFGSGGVCTADIGRAILRSDWKGAVELVLAKRGGDHPDAALAKHIWRKTGDAQRALDIMPPWVSPRATTSTFLRRL